jgi:hypothetical protein
VNSRTVAALLLAPIACSLASGVLILWGAESPEGSHSRLLFVAFFAGIMYGALFEVFALLPLLLVLRRMQKSTRGTLFTGGALLWGAVVILYVFANSEFSWLQLPLSAFGSFLVPLLLPGLVLVLVFAFVAQGRQNAT